MRFDKCGITWQPTPYYHTKNENSPEFRRMLKFIACICTAGQGNAVYWNPIGFPRKTI